MNMLTGQCLIKIDGRKLKEAGYAGKPIDYWGFGDKDEMEDRVFSDKPDIPNAMKYIEEIHIYVRGNHTNKINRMLRRIGIISKQNNVPIYAYDDVKGFNLLNKSKATSIAKLSPTNKLKAELPDTEKGEDDDMYTRGYKRKVKEFGAWLELLNTDKTNLKDLSKEARQKFYDAFGWNRRDAINTLRTHIHNNRTHRIGGRDALDRFMAAMKKKRIFSIEELFDHLEEKFGDK